MRYAVLIYGMPGAVEALPEPDQQRVYGEYMTLIGDAAVVESSHLEPPASAKTVRVEAGRAFATDGPFADSKEVFAGFYIVEVERREQALEFAARVPATWMGGCVEVRPLAES